MKEIKEGLSSHVAGKEGSWLPPSLSKSQNWGLGLAASGACARFSTVWEATAAAAAAAAQSSS